MSRLAIKPKDIFIMFASGLLIGAVINYLYPIVFIYILLLALIFTLLSTYFTAREYNMMRKIELLQPSSSENKVETSTLFFYQTLAETLAFFAGLFLSLIIKFF